MRDFVEDQVQNSSFGRGAAMFFPGFYSSLISIGEYVTRLIKLDTIKMRGIQMEIMRKTVESAGNGVICVCTKLVKVISLLQLSINVDSFSFYFASKLGAKIAYFENAKNKVIIN